MTPLQLKTHPLFNELQTIAMLGGIQSILGWDQETYMPEQAITARAKQMALMAELRHQRFTGKNFKAYLSDFVDLNTGAINSELSEKDRILIKEICKDYQKAVTLPPEFVTEYAHATAESQHAWDKAKQSNTFGIFKPHLEKVIGLTQKKAAYLGTGKAYDTLLDDYEPAMTSARLTPLFQELRQEIVTLLPKIQAKQKQQKAIDLQQYTYELQTQRQFSERLLKAMHYDFKRGRLDESSHPFTTEFHPTDVRITTRFKPHDLMEGISGTIHEGGHALYEQGLNADWYGTPLCQATSLGIHESQSRLWEHFIGTGRPFWTYFYPVLQQYFPTQLQDISRDQFYTAITQVTPGPIRVAADEVTYNLHILIRFELEQLIFEGSIDLSELPQLWNQKYKAYLGITPENDSQGLLQDVHWSMGAFGYFPTYTLGNLYGCMIYEAAGKQLPDLETHIQTGNLLPLKNWLNTSIYSVGRLQTPEDLIQSVSGQGLSVKPFVAYLENKYGGL